MKRFEIVISESRYGFSWELHCEDDECATSPVHYDTHDEAFDECERFLEVAKECLYIHVHTRKETKKRINLGFEEKNMQNAKPIVEYLFQRYPPVSLNEEIEIAKNLGYDDLLQPLTYERLRQKHIERIPSSDNPTLKEANLGDKVITFLARKSEE